MKKLKPKIRSTSVKRRRAVTCRQASPLSRCLPVPENEYIQSQTKAITTLQPQQEVLQQETGWERLAAQARHINQLAAQLEQAMFEFKVIANDVNCKRRTQNTKKSIKSVCEYLTTIVPCVGRRKSGVFVLTTRKVDLFQAEREALEIAQKLRRQAKRRRVGSSITADKRSLLGWLI